MNKVKKYFKINDKLSPFDFREFDIKRIDEELKTILNDLYNNDDSLTNKGIKLDNKQVTLFSRDVDY
jgi:preprotein translocase subunit SecA